jgi:outer membrane protein TolC
MRRLLLLILGFIIVMRPTVTGASNANLSLHEAMRLVLRNNPNIQAAREGVDQAEISVNKTWTILGPTITAQAAHSWNNEVSTNLPVADPSQPGVLSQPNAVGGCDLPPNPQGFAQPVSTGPACITQRPSSAKIVVRPAESTTLSLTATQPIFNGQFVPAIQAAWSNSDAVKEAYRSTEDSLLAATAQHYFGVILAFRLSEILAESRLTLRSHLDRTTLKYNIGQIPKTALLQAQIEFSKVESEEVSSRDNYFIALRSFESMLGVSGVLLPALTDATMATRIALDFPSDLTATAVANRHDLKAAKLQLEMARSVRTGAWAKFSPTLFLNGTLQRTDSPGAFGEKDSWNVMAIASLPLVQGGSRVFDIQFANSQLRQASAAVVAKTEYAKIDVDSSISKLRLAGSRSQTAFMQASLAKENLAITRVSFENGLGTSLDVIDANQLVMRAELNAAQEQVNLLLAQIALWNSLGLLQEKVLNVKTE